MSGTSSPNGWADEIRRHLLKLYGVRDAEMSNYSTIED